MLNQRVERKFGKGHSPPHRDEKEGDDVKLVFTIFLQQIEQWNYIDRMPEPTTAAKIPRNFIESIGTSL